MIKLSIVTGGTTISIELESLDITVKEFKSFIEEKIPESKRIPADKQLLYVKQKRLENDKKMSEYITEQDEGIKIFVLKETKSVLSTSNENKPQAPTSQQPKPQAGNPYMSNPYMGAMSQHQGFNTPQYPPYPPYPPMYPPQMGSPQPQMYPPPMGSPQMYPPPYGGYPPYGGMPQMPPGGTIPKEVIDMAMNNPQIFDTIIEAQHPNASQEEKERAKKLYMDAFKMVQENPNLLNSINQMNQVPPYGYPPQPMMYPGGNEYFNRNQGYGPHSPQLSREAYKARYARQLSALKEMGFDDDEENLSALIAEDGDINLALDRLRKDANFSKK